MNHEPIIFHSIPVNGVVLVRPRRRACSFCDCHLAVNAANPAQRCRSDAGGGCSESGEFFESGAERTGSETLGRTRRILSRIPARYAAFGPEPERFHFVCLPGTIPISRRFRRRNAAPQSKLESAA